MAFTQEQLKAINSEGSNIIVSAGAGSGKTAVLTQRVLRKVKSGIHINNLLILTFTNKASMEMRQRIRKTLKEEGYLEEVNLIDNSYITTFDSYFLAVVKKYYYKVGISSNVKISEEAIINIEIKKIIEQVLAKEYILQNKDFTKFIYDFCLKNDDLIKDLLFKINNKLDMKIDKEEYLKNYMANMYSDAFITKSINEYVEIIFSYLNSLKDTIKDLELYFDNDYITKLEDAFTNLFNCSTYEDITRHLDIKIPMVPRGSSLDAKEEKKKLKTILDKLKTLTTYKTKEEIKDDIISTYSNTQVFINLLLKIDKLVTNFKLENDLYSFTDIAKLAIKILKENNDVVSDLKNKYQEILVDEYQDTNDLQEEFLNLLENNNLYMVGDIKQSIYRFRNANCYIFKDKYDLYKENNKGIKIDLVKNFRSRGEVLENVNLIFDNIMDNDIGGANYKKEHRLIFGNNAYILEGNTNQDYNMSILTYNNKDSKYKKEEIEAYLIAKDIKEKIVSKYKIFDKDKLILRDVVYSDFVILLSRYKNFTIFKKVFEKMGIPLYEEKDEEIKSNTDILIIKNLIKLIICLKNNDYKQEFKYYFTSIARSYLFNMSDSKIFNYFTTNNFKDNEVFNKASKMLEYLDTTSPNLFLEKLITIFNIEEKIITTKDIKSKRVRLEFFYNLFKSFSEEGITIYEIAEYLDIIIKDEGNIKFHTSNSNDNSVSIMTIFKSKGLEFPICYFSDLTAKFNLQELKDIIYYDNKYGVILPFINGYIKPTIFKLLIEENIKKEEISERMRLFYVALTRAKEQMIIVMPEIEKYGECDNRIVSKERRLTYHSFYDILKSVAANIDRYFVKKEVEDIPILKTKELTKEEDILQVEELNINSNLLTNTHYSKNNNKLLDNDNKKLLEYGTKIHEILEYIDFKRPDLTNVDSFIKDKVEAFLNKDLIKNNLNSKMYHEYSFSYKKDNLALNGVIDLLIETSNKLIIIDYKLKNINDSLYEEQVNGYRNYLKTKTNKQIDCYLYSLIEEEFRKV